ncbi:MAG: methylenetetrahydrofolate reductase [NAD(P)H] [Gammaproteobacteria bacterium]|nr:methylenetetrahydrofolate reductase [NAD(P)H] [Gammaproteobacteria bacterium]
MKQLNNLSFELFPPKTEEGMENMQAAVAELTAAKPDYFSVTFGAGGSTRDRTFATVDWLMGQGIDAAPHISCIGASREEMAALLARYREKGVKRLVALRGDLPSGAGSSALGDLHYANELVSFIREDSGDHFQVEVAAYPEVHPQAKNARADLENFKRKVDAGADGAITQYFFNAEAYFRFVEECQGLGVEIAIIPGIMPVTNYSQLARFSDACGADIPRWMRKRLEGFGDDLESIRAFGEEVVTRLCQELVDGGAPGLHFYTMNRSTATLKVLSNLT